MFLYTKHIVFFLFLYQYSIVYSTYLLYITSEISQDIEQLARAAAQSLGLQLSRGGSKNISSEHQWKIRIG